MPHMLSSPLTCQMRVINRRHETDGNRRTSIPITQVIAQALELLDGDIVFIIQNDIMCRTHRALQPRMRDEEDVFAVPVFDYRAWGNIAEPVAVARQERE